MTYEQATERAKRMLAKRTMAQLITDWELAERLPYTLELTVTRGWLLDEFKRRDPEAYDAWGEAYCADADDVSPRDFFKVV